MTSSLEQAVVHARSAETITGQWTYRTVPIIETIAGDGIEITDATSRAGLIQVRHNRPAHFFMHLTNGALATDAIIGLGVDNGGAGLLIDNYKTGRGLIIQQIETVSDSGAFAFAGYQKNNVAAFAQWVQTVNDAAPLLRLGNTAAAPVAGTHLLELFTNSFGSFLTVDANTGLLETSKGLKSNGLTVAANGATIAGRLTLTKPSNNTTSESLQEWRNFDGSAVMASLAGTDGASTSVTMLTISSRARFGYNNGAVQIDDNAQNKPLVFLSNNSEKLRINGTGIGAFTATPAGKQTVTGSRGGNAALASLLTAFATFGFITDSTTA